MDLVVEVYRATEAFPRHEAFGLIRQMQRAAVSIPSNVAEGHTRAYTREYLHHIAMAHGSLAELQTQLEISVRLGYLEDSSAAAMVDHALALSKQLNALRTSLSDRLAKSQIPTPNSQHVP
jgi:four helix bundle protein